MLLLNKNKPQADCYNISLYIQQNILKSKRFSHAHTVVNLLANVFTHGHDIVMTLLHTLPLNSFKPGVPFMGHMQTA